MVDVTKNLQHIFYRPLKEMLGVRQQTPNHIAVVESGCSHIADTIEKRQRKFINKLMQSRHLDNSPAKFALKLAERFKTKAWNYLRTFPPAPTDRHLDECKTNIRTKQTTRYLTYYEMNPALALHAVYTQTDLLESHRVAFTRLRLASHRLKIETGRWSRTPRENRLCPCNPRQPAVQDELHMISQCPLTQSIRDQFPNVNFTNMDSFMDGNPNQIRLPFVFTKCF